MTSHLDQKIEYYEDYLDCLKRGEIEPEPWKYWQKQRVGYGEWRVLTCAPWWTEDCIYRRKPKMCSINGHEYPEPMRVEPAYGTRCYSPNCLNLKLQFAFVYCDSDFGEMLLKRGALHATKEAAIDHAKAMILGGGGVLEGV